MASYAVLGAVGYGAADFTGGLTARRFSIPRVMAFSQGTATVIIGAAQIISGGHPAGTDLLRGAAAGFLLFIGVALAYTAFSRGDIGPAAALLGVFSAVVPVAGAAFTGDRIGPMTLIGIGAGLFAVAAFADGAGVPGWWLPSLYAASAGAAFGAYHVVMSETSAAAGLAPLTAAQIVVTALAGGWYLLRSRTDVYEGRGPVLAVVAGAVEAAGAVAALWAVRTGNLAVVGVILALAPAVSVVLARLVLREQITVRRAVGLVAAGIAVGVLAGAA